ncbi:hypothetical protein [Phocaeicola sartorii]|uniref:hypothetical protein n=1 Tax=Phocaeicola sartorii TaxID=671267 RepID=UPI00351799C8
MKKLRCVPITEPWQVELMRCIYNENLEWLSTHTLPYRTYEDQQEWWQKNSRQVKAFLYEPFDKPGKFVAFLLLRIRDGFCTPTIALQREEWGSGYGQEIVHDYIEKADGPIAGTQLQNNEAICHINKKVGWQILGETGEGDKRIDLLYHPGINELNKCSEGTFLKILEYLDIDPSTFDFSKVNI